MTTLRIHLARVGLALGIAGVGYFACYRPLEMNWGATPQEVLRSMPGDRIIAAPIFCATRGVTIAVSADRIWPWIAQIGKRGVGWYSYDLIDNGSQESAAHIVPGGEYSVGERVPLSPDQEKGFRVKGIAPPHWMLVGNRSMSWVWELIPDGNERTRLVSRIRMSGGLSPLAVAAVDLGDFVMLRQMLNGIRDRAEGRAIRSFASLTAEFLLWVSCFVGFLIAELRVVTHRRSWIPAILASAASGLTITLVMWQPPLWVDALGAAAILAGLVAEQQSST